MPVLKSIMLSAQFFNRPFFFSCYFCCCCCSYIIYFLTSAHKLLLTFQDAGHIFPFFMTYFLTFYIIPLLMLVTLCISFCWDLVPLSSVVLITLSCFLLCLPLTSTYIISLLKAHFYFIKYQTPGLWRYSLIDR